MQTPAQRAGGHVAHGVAARLARGDADGGEAPHQRRRVVDVDEVELEVLARGDVDDAVGVLLGEVGQDLELPGVDAAERDLDPLHAGRVPQRGRPLGEAAATGRPGCCVSTPSWRWPLS